MKFCPFEQVHIVDHSGLVDESAARVQAVREAIGPNVDILLDFHGRSGRQWRSGWKKRCARSADVH